MKSSCDLLFATRLILGDSLLVSHMCQRCVDRFSCIGSFAIQKFVIL